MENRKKRGCGKLRGKRGKLFGDPSKIGFSTGSAEKVFRCGERLTGIRAKCDNPCRRSGDVGRNPTGFPVISDGFGITFPIRVVPKNRRKALPERVFAGFYGFPQSPHPLLRLLRLLFFFLSFFPLPPRTENSVCRFAGLQSGGKKCGYRACLVGDETMISPSSTNFLPFLSGSGEKRQLCQSRLTGLTSEQPEFAARQIAAPKICTT